MTKDDIIRMAREAGFVIPAYRNHVEMLERFAALVAAAEREACAEIVEGSGYKSNGISAYEHIAAAIRARGEK